MKTTIEKFADDFKELIKDANKEYLNNYLLKEIKQDEKNFMIKMQDFRIKATSGKYDITGWIKKDHNLGYIKMLDDEIMMVVNMSNNKLIDKWFKINKRVSYYYLFNNKWEIKLSKNTKQGGE